jgi:hypothetical protein
LAQPAVVQVLARAPVVAEVAAAERSAQVVVPAAVAAEAVPSSSIQ